MKKTYIAPASQSLDMRCDGMLALSAKNPPTDLSEGDFGSDGDYEYNSRKGYWEMDWYNPFQVKE